MDKFIDFHIGVFNLYRNVAIVKIRKNDISYGIVLREGKNLEYRWFSSESERDVAFDQLLTSYYLLQKENKVIE